MRAAEIARLLPIDVRTVRRWIKDGTLPSVKVGGARLVPVGDLEKVLTGAVRQEFDPPDKPRGDPAKTKPKRTIGKAYPE